MLNNNNELEPNINDYNNKHLNEMATRELNLPVVYGIIHKENKIEKHNTNSRTSQIESNKIILPDIFEKKSN